MSSSGSAKAREATEQQAADYVVALSDNPSRQLQQEVAEWLRHSAAHAVAFAQAERAWEAAARLNAPRQMAQATISAGPGDHDILVAPLASRRRFLVGGAAAASVAGLIGFSWLDSRQKIQTAVGEVRDVTLEDGSTLHLNTNSRVVVSMSPKRRLVRLLQGEAYFDVAHNPAVPFDVEVGDAIVRALGTAFNIRVRPDLVELTVTHGLVGVRTSEGATEKVPAGDGAFIQRNTVALTTLPSHDLEQRTVWRERAIELDGESVAQAVEEFNRYRTKPIIIGDQRVAPLRVGGRFQLDKADEFLAALRQTLPVETVANSDGSVLLLYSDPTQAREPGQATATSPNAGPVPAGDPPAPVVQN